MSLIEYLLQRNQYLSGPNEYLSLAPLFSFHRPPLGKLPPHIIIVSEIVIDGACCCLILLGVRGDRIHCVSRPPSFSFAALLSLKVSNDSQMASSTRSSSLRAYVLLLAIASTSAYINHDQAWQFSCAAAGETSKATLITRLDTDEPKITTYDIRAGITWGDQYSEGDKYTLAVGETHKITFEHAFEAEDGQEEVTMKYRRFEIPAEDTVLGVAYNAIGSQRKEIVTVTQDECIVEGQDGDSGEALTFSKGEDDTSDAKNMHATNVISVLQYAAAVSIAIWWGY